jgi:hypothetical protein
MIWEPRAVYGFVRAAGFRTDQWAPAVALVLACSGGDDLFRDVAWPGPALDRRGLFGLDVVAHPELAGVDLFDPRSNCHAAYALSVAANGDWGWAGCPMPATDSEAFTAAKAAVRAGPGGQVITAGGVGPVSSPATRRVMVDLAGISDYVRSRIVSGG